MTTRNDPLGSLRFVNPLPQKLWGANCSLCDKPQSRWAILKVTPTPIFLCGLCILHKSEWGKSNSPAVTSTVERIQATADRKFEMADGKLTRCSEADDVLGVIILVERTLARSPTGKR